MHRGMYAYTTAYAQELPEASASMGEYMCIRWLVREGAGIGLCRFIFDGSCQKAPSRPREHEGMFRRFARAAQAWMNASIYPTAVCSAVSRRLPNHGGMCARSTADALKSPRARPSMEAWTSALLWVGPQTYVLHVLHVRRKNP